MHTVRKMARMAGVSVRTLHHYDAIGLLKPAQTGENGYRYYGREEMLRLQHILVYRALDIPLGEIGQMLDAPGFDRMTILETQREKVAAQAERFAQILETIDRTIENLKGDRTMSDTGLYSGIIDSKKQAEYEAWLAERFGPHIQAKIETSRTSMTALSDAERVAMMEELKAVEQGLAEGLRRGLPPQSRALDPLLARHWDWVQSSWGQPADVSAYAGLADMYLAHPDFIARYESIEKGFAEYLSTAMKSWAKRQE